jgi:hypothetical protein
MKITIAVIISVFLFGNVSVPRQEQAELSIIVPVMTATVSGRVTRHDGTPVSNVFLSTQDGAGNVRIARTNPFGYYRFFQLPIDQSYTISARSKGYSFPDRSLFLVGDVENFDFIADKN